MSITRPLLIALKRRKDRTGTLWPDGAVHVRILNVVGQVIDVDVKSILVDIAEYVLNQEGVMECPRLGHRLRKFFPRHAT